METTAQTQIPQPPIFDWLEDFRAELVAGMSDRAKGIDPLVSDKIGQLVTLACDPDGEKSLDTLFCFIAAGNGLHSAAQQALALGDGDWSAELHSLGELFATYASGNLAAIVDMANQNAADIERERAAVAGAPTVH